MIFIAVRGIRPYPRETGFSNTGDVGARRTTTTAEAPTTSKN